ncbi:Kappa-carrageenase precursor [Pelotomaculum schinkii]|uniref:Kappa-carrageenase n=1 Tax=Pelotomaculum schinkii TaxID=78350 RepID=A0A4Y7RE62_9FIRM|nr:Ig-like domain-containing protein [Pelotomaculum schinkii]TEB07063.1 Kappa-carrageenase precursor [Pelotomaculum schinkii]
MRLKGLKFKYVSQKAVVLVVMSTLLLSLLWMAKPGTASADSGSIGVPADTLTIKVGYFGGPYYTKKVYTASDLDAMPQVQQAYTFIDNMPAVVIDSAKGIKLTDLLADAGIDVNSVEAFYFYATDTKVGWYQCLPKSYLLDTARYYYPNLPTHWDSDTHSSIPGAVYGAIRVAPIIATRDNWQRFATAPDFSVNDTSTRFRLLFGQDDTNTRTAFRSVKWVHAIEVMLGGTPPSGVTLDQGMVNLKVGSTVQLTATVGPDDATDKSVTWSSSDTSVATVDNNGLVTVVGQGTATITVSTVVGNMTATCIVNDPNQDAGAQTIVPTSAGPEKDGSQGALSQQQYLTEKTESVAGVNSSRAGSQPWRVYEMSADAVPLQKQKEQNNLDIYAAMIFLCLFLLGAGRRYAEYAKEI